MWTLQCFFFIAWTQNTFSEQFKNMIENEVSFDFNKHILTPDKLTLFTQIVFYSQS